MFSFFSGGKATEHRSISARWVGLDGHSRSVKNAAENAYNEFMGISTQAAYDFAHNDRGYETAWAASVWAKRCIEINANAFMALPTRCIDNRNGEALPDNHPFTELFDWRSQKLRWLTMTQFQIYGRAFWKSYLNGRKVQYMTLNPTTIEVLRNRFGVHGFIQRIGGQLTAEFSADELVYFYDYDTEDDLNGIPAIAWILRTIGVDISTEQFTKTFFENDATPGGLLSTEQRLQPQDQQRIASYWAKDHKGMDKKHRTAILSDGVTYQTITPPMKDLAQEILDEKTKRRIAAAFGVPMTIAGMDDAANYATAKEQHILFYTATAIPDATLLFDTVNKEVAPLYGDVRVEVARDEIDVLQEDRVEITTRSTQGYAGGVRSLNEARELEGLPLFEVDYFLVPGVGLVKRDELEAGVLPQINAPATPNPFSPFQLPTAANTDVPPQLETPVDTEKSVGLSACVLLSLANNTDLIALQKQLQGMFQEVEWNAPSDFHVTVCYLPTVEESQLSTIADIVKSIPCPEMSLRLGSLHTFDNLGSHAIHFRVRRSTELEEYQEALYNALSEAGLGLSAYSLPDSYIPHITMGYAKNKSNAITYQSKLTVTPDKVVLSSSQDGGEMIGAPDTVLYEAPLAPMIVESTPVTRAAKDLQILELKQWKRKASKLALAPFETTYLDSVVADFIRMDLAQGLAPKDVFDNALKAVDTDDPNFATPEEFESYWQGIGKLYDALQNAMLQSWANLPAQLATAIRAEGEVANLELVLQQHEKDVVNYLVGDNDTPGALTKVVLAGAARGNDLLVRASKGMTIAWDLLNQEAFEWARNFANQQVILVGQTTRQALTDNVAAWIASGEPLGKLADAIEGTLDLKDMTIPQGFSPEKIAWLTSPERAALIAQTEATSAFTQGAFTRWKQAGYNEFRWRTNNDPRVCALCRRLNNKTGAISQGVYDETTGKYYYPPAHSGCRCPVSVIV